jgi:hypothetical protein
VSVPPLPLFTHAATAKQFSTEGVTLAVAKLVGVEVLVEFANLLKTPVEACPDTSSMKPEFWSAALITFRFQLVPSPDCTTR